MIKDPVISILFGLSLIFLFVAAVVISISLSGVTGPFVIHFNERGQADLIAGGEDVSNIIFMAGIVILINFVLAFKVYGREKVLSYVFSGVSFVIAFFVLIASYLISSIN